MTIKEQTNILENLKEEINDLPPFDIRRNAIANFNLYNILWGFEVSEISEGKLKFLERASRAILDGNTELYQENTELFDKMQLYIKLNNLWYIPGTNKC